MEKINLNKFINKKIVFTTSDENNQPRSILVIPSKITTGNIIISNVQMNKSIKNAKINPKVFINMYDEDTDSQYKIDGIATIYKEGKLFEEIKKYEETENLPPELKVNSIIVVKITNIEESIG